MNILYFTKVLFKKKLHYISSFKLDKIHSSEDNVKAILVNQLSIFDSVWDV